MKAQTEIDTQIENSRRVARGEGVWEPGGKVKGFREHRAVTKQSRGQRAQHRDVVSSPAAAVHVAECVLKPLHSVRVSYHVLSTWD